MTDLETAANGSALEDESRPVSREGARRRRGGGRSEPPPTDVRRRRSWPFGVVTLLFVAGLVVMAWQGYETSLDIRGGTSLNSPTNPKAANYQAQVSPTPTHLIVNPGPDGKIGDLELLVPASNGKGGGLLFIPGLTVVKDGDKSQNLQAIADQEGLPALVDAVQQALGIAITDAVALTTDQFTQLFTPAGPLTVQNPDNLVRSTGGTATTVFAAGTLTLQPKDVVNFLGFANAGEPVVNRPARAEPVWQAWLTAIAAGGSSAQPKLAPINQVGGGDQVDLSSLIDGLSTGSVNYQQLPVDRLPVPNQNGFAIYEPNADAVTDLMAHMVPFPGSAFPGQRVRVRLLNGTTDPNATLRAAEPIVSANSQILVLGNASSFDVAKTQVQYNSDQQANAAKAIAAKLGVSAPTRGDDSDAIDVTVILGKDFRG